MSEIRFRHDHKVDCVDFMGGDNQVAMSAWVSFNQDDEERLSNKGKVKGLINFLYRNEHMTPFESSAFTFRIETPIFVARELFRHRSASYNEWSGRYSKMIPEFYLPTPERPLRQEGKAGDYRFVPGDDNQYAILSANQRAVYQASWDAYLNQLDAGIAKEAARNILPLGIYTQFYVTMNARNLMHFLNLRTDTDALYEIRAVANQMENILCDKMPMTYAAYKEKK